MNHGKEILDDLRQPVRALRDQAPAARHRDVSWRVH